MLCDSVNYAKPRIRIRPKPAKHVPFAADSACPNAGLVFPDSECSGPRPAAVNRTLAFHELVTCDPKRISSD